jgi:hypothetical protein
VTLDGVSGPPTSSSVPPTLAYTSRLVSMTYCSGAMAKHEDWSLDMAGWMVQPRAW